MERTIMWAILLVAFYCTVSGLQKKAGGCSIENGGINDALCLVSVGVAAIHGLTDVQPTQQYKQSLTLDPDNKYMVYWDFNATHITFEVHVETLGYVGFGLSRNGDMAPADVVIGWVKDGHTHFSDRHTTAHSAPLLDAHQDWFLLHGEENNKGTMLKFVRKHDTCDKDDIKINTQTIRLIYAYHPDDPHSDAQADLMYHGPGRRGTKSVSLLSSSLPPPISTNDDIKIYEFRSNNVAVPARGTTYICTGFQMPDLGQKHHMIEYEPIYTPGNERLIHHVLILRCDGRHPEIHMKSAECPLKMPHDWPFCSETMIVWATGGGAFYFPENTGYSIGAPDDWTVFVMQTHYNNPGHRAGVIDDSGIRMKLTTRLRTHDVTSLIVGHHVDKLHVIPPRESSFITQGYCVQDCLEKSMEEANVPELKAIAAFQHAHLLSAGIRTRHFRNGTEIEPLVDDPSYDFFFQEFRPLIPEKTIKKGDSFIVECNYNTQNKTAAMFGGLSIHDEMCLTVLYVYPKTSVRRCDSRVVWDTYPESGSQLRHKFENMNWNDPAVRSDFDMKLAASKIRHRCDIVYSNATIFFYKQDFVEHPTTNPYVAPPEHCAN